MGKRTPLSGVTVIDCGQVVAGPMIAAVLSDFGADVIKVEHPKGGDQLRYFGRAKDGVPLLWKLLARNKKSITLDLSLPKGQELFSQLVSTTKADVVIESFRPGTFERWNLSYGRLRSLSPGVIFVRVSGFGQSGPYRNRPGFGTLAEAMSGFAHVTGDPDGPPTLPPFPLADSFAAMYGAVGTLLALYHRDVNGATGQSVDVSLLEPLFSVLGSYLLEFDQLGIVGQRRGNRSATAPRNVYQTGDGRWVAIAASTQSVVARVFTAIGRPELLDDPRFRTNADRLANVDDLDRIVGEWVSQRQQFEVVETLLGADVAVAPILDIEQLTTDPQLQARGAIVAVPDLELGQLRMPAPLPVLSETPGRIRHAGPTLGEHNLEVFHGLLGLTETEMQALRSEGVI